jgi:hypothetical protein
MVGDHCVHVKRFASYPIAGEDRSVEEMMGYCVYITRAKTWVDANMHPISETEWLRVVEDDPTLSVNREDFSEYRDESGQTRRTHPVEWSGSHDGNCLWWRGGAINCKNPSDAWTSKMVALAKLLQAKVVGEQGEEYA